MPPYLYDLVSIQVSLLVVTTHAFHLTLGYSDQTIITQSLVVTQLYALPAWGGFLTVELTNKIDIFLRKAVKWGYAQKVTSLSELLRNADEKLFSKMRSSNHSIHQLLPPAKTLPMKLRSTHCVFALPQCNYNLYKSSFVLRNLFLDAY